MNDVMLHRKVCFDLWCGGKKKGFGYLDELELDEKKFT